MSPHLVKAARKSSQGGEGLASRGCTSRCGEQQRNLVGRALPIRTSFLGPNQSPLSSPGEEQVTYLWDPPGCGGWGGSFSTPRSSRVLCSWSFYLLLEPWCLPIYFSQGLEFRCRAHLERAVPTAALPLSLRAGNRASRQAGSSQGRVTAPRVGVGQTRCPCPGIDLDPRGEDAG